MNQRVIRSAIFTGIMCAGLFSMAVFARHAPAEPLVWWQAVSQPGLPDYFAQVDTTTSNFADLTTTNAKAASRSMAHWRPSARLYADLAASLPGFDRHVTELHAKPLPALQEPLTESMAQPGHTSSTTLADVDFADPELRECISNTNIELLENITTLACLNVVDLSGIEHLTNLKYLYLLKTSPQYGLRLYNLKRIEQLSHLRGLSITDLFIDQAELAITFPPNLISITLDNANITSLTGAKLPANLWYLELPNNPISDLSTLINALPAPTELIQLTISFTEIADLQALTLLPNLKYLVAKGLNKVSDFSILGDLNKLESLDISGALLPTKFPDFVLPATLKYLYIPAFWHEDATVVDIGDIVNMAAQWKRLDLSEQVTIDCAQIETLRNHPNHAAFRLPQTCGVEQKLLSAATVPDPVLRQCLAEKGYKRLNSVYALSCQGNVHNWQGIRYLSKLTRLFVSGNQETPSPALNLAEFAQLQDLTFLALHRQGLTDQTIQALSGRVVQNLILPGNLLTQASFAQITTAFPWLRQVVLSDNQINDLTNISQLNVENIGLLGNSHITDYKPLHTLGSKTIALALQPATPEQLHGVRLPAQISSLELSGQAIRNAGQVLALLPQPASLTSLIIDSATLDSLEGIAAASNLQHLLLIAADNRALQDYSPLNHLDKLRQLEIRHAGFMSLNQIQTRLPTLRYFSLIGSGVTDFTLLSNLNKELLSLGLQYSAIQDLSLLHPMTQLYQLDLTGNSHLSCEALETLRLTLPVTNIALPELCSADSALRFRMTNDAVLTAASFADAGDSQYGRLSVSNGQLIFQPARGVSGWLTLTLTVTVQGGVPQVIKVRFWIDPAGLKPVSKGLPWWVLLAQQASSFVHSTAPSKDQATTKEAEPIQATAPVKD